MGKVDSTVTLNTLHNLISTYLGNFTLESPKRKFSYIQTGLFTDLLEIHSTVNFLLAIMAKAILTPDPGTKDLSFL